MIAALRFIAAGVLYGLGEAIEHIGQALTWARKWGAK